MLDFLKKRAPEWYAYATSGLDRIILDPGIVQYGITSGVYLDERTWAMTPERFSHRDAISLAGGLVHEACHVHRYEAGLPSYGLEGETACVQTQLEAVTAIDAHSPDLDFLRYTLENINDPEHQWWR